MKNEKESRMGTVSIGRLMLELSLPCIIAQVINVLYSIVDRVYIGHIEGVGAEALTGVGLTFPITLLVAAFSAFAAVGGSSLAAIQLGRGDREEAEGYLGGSLWTLIFFTILLMVFFYAFSEPFLYMFGASENTIGFASIYLKIYLAGTIFVELALGLNPFIIIQGRPGIAMCSIIAGAIINIILDPIFIYTLDMGVAGAAIATVISQFVSGAWNVWFLVSKMSTLKIRRKDIRYDRRMINKIMALGVSPFTMQATECLINIVMNRQLQIYGGDLYVGSMTIIQSVMMFMYAPTKGFTQGVQALVSYNFGAGKFDRVRKTYRRMIGCCVVYGCISTSSEILFPGFFGSLFTTNAELIHIIERVMPVFLIGMLIFGTQDGIQSTFLGLGQAKISLFIAMLRKVFLLVPLALILPNFFGIMGVYYAEPISDILSVTTASILFKRNIERYLSFQSLEKFER